MFHVENCRRNQNTSKIEIIRFFPVACFQSLILTYRAHGFIKRKFLQLRFQLTLQYISIIGTQLSPDVKKRQSGYIKAKLKQ